MAALKKALLALFGGRQNIPREEDVEIVAKRMFKDVCDAVQDDGVDGQVVTEKDLYTFLVRNSESGISRKTVQQLFKKIDTDGSGLLEEEEFVEVIRRCRRLLCAELAGEDMAASQASPVIVVPASASHNVRSGTQAFCVDVLRQDTMRQLWQWFQDLDADKDGFITLPELKRYFKRTQFHAAGMSSSIFKSLDKQGKGRLTFKSLLQSLYPGASQKQLTALVRMAKPQDYQPSKAVDEELISDVRNIFKIFDDDGNGTLDMEEFTYAFSVLGFDEADVRSMFKEIDKDGSGQVSIQEFEEWYGDGQRLQAKRAREAGRDSDADD